VVGFVEPRQAAPQNSGATDYTSEVEPAMRVEKQNERGRATSLVEKSGND
jgi:hypothetical protein